MFQRARPFASLSIVMNLPYFDVGIDQLAFVHSFQILLGLFLFLLHFLVLQFCGKIGTESVLIMRACSCHRSRAAQTIFLFVFDNEIVSADGQFVRVFLLDFLQPLLEFLLQYRFAIAEFIL